MPVAGLFMKFKVTLIKNFINLTFWWPKVNLYQVFNFQISESDQTLRDDERYW